MDIIIISFIIYIIMCICGTGMIRDEIDERFERFTVINIESNKYKIITFFTVNPFVFALCLLIVFSGMIFVIYVIAQIVNQYLIHFGAGNIDYYIDTIADNWEWEREQRRQLTNYFNISKKE